MSIRTTLHLTHVRLGVTFLVAMVVAALYVPHVLLISEIIFFFTLLVLCPASAIISLLLLLAALSVRKNRVAAGLLVNGITVALVSTTMFLAPFYEAANILTLEDKVSWMLYNKEYKHSLGSQTPQRNDLSHIPFHLNNAGVWLVFDPSDLLGDDIGHHGFVPNIPCPVGRIEKLSKHYYVVYEDEEFTWDTCPAESQSRQPLGSPRSWINYRRSALLLEMTANNRDPARRMVSTSLVASGARANRV